MDLHDPLADLGALYAEAQEEHNRGDEFATVCMRLIERLAETPITTLHLVDDLNLRMAVMRDELARRTQERDEGRAEVAALHQALRQVLNLSDLDEARIILRGVLPSGEKGGQP